MGREAFTLQRTETSKAVPMISMNSIWRGVEPNDRAASIACGETWRSPKLVSRMAGGKA